MVEKKKTLLIVDDEDEIRENLSDFAEFKGFEVFQAPNGRDALDVIEQKKPDMVISDFKMPQMTGLEMLQELGRRGSDVPVVIMTAFGTMEYAIDAMKNGASDFITKPIDLQYMMKVVERVLRRRAVELKVKEQQEQLDDDLRHAATIQRCLLPTQVDTPAFNLSYRYEPLIAIGGDYMTVHHYSDKKIAVALYDVSGHGVSAALTATLIHNHLQQRLAEHRPPSNVADLVNKFISNNIAETRMFATMVIFVIDAEDGTFTITNAGHPEAYFWKSNEETLQAVTSHVPPVGFTPKLLGDNNESTFEIGSGDRVMLYTDGFIETENAAGERTGKKGLREMVERHCRLQPQEFLQNMYDELKTFRGEVEPDDDLTFLVLDVK